jgi:hypothetical protein
MEGIRNNQSSQNRLLNVSNIDSASADQTTLDESAGSVLKRKLWMFRG